MRPAIKPECASRKCGFLHLSAITNKTRKKYCQHKKIYFITDIKKLFRVDAHKWWASYAIAHVQLQKYLNNHCMQHRARQDETWKIYLKFAAGNCGVLVARTCPQLDWWYIPFIQPFQLIHPTRKTRLGDVQQQDNRHVTHILWRMGAH